MYMSFILHFHFCFYLLFSKLTKEKRKATFSKLPREEKSSWGLYGVRSERLGRIVLGCVCPFFGGAVLLLLCFQARVSLCNGLGCHGTSFVNQDGLELRHLPASVVRMLRLKTCAIMP